MSSDHVTRFRVEVTLSSVRELVEDADDARGSMLERSTWPDLERLFFVGRVIVAGSGARSAQNSSQGEIPNDSMTAGKQGESESIKEGQQEDANLQSAVRRDVFKYVQVKDRYMALVSILMKSRTYHQSMTSVRCDTGVVAASPTAHDDNPRRPLVLLPRTPHGKPYIPMTTSSTLTCDGGVGPGPLPFNVSHQYPVVGIARLSPCLGVRGMEASTMRGLDLNINLQIGLDVVMFDPYPPGLYDNAVEFVEAFRDKLTHEEWDNLMGIASAHDNDNELPLLREFYLHWAIKEAYTKAVGVGLGYDFASVHLELVSSSASTTTGSSYGDYFASVLSSGSSPVLVPAKVHLLAEGRRIENWSVALHPIFLPPRTRHLDPSDANGEHMRTLEDVAGCFCVVVGPDDLNGASNELKFERDVKVDWLDPPDLVHFHAS